MQAFGSLLLTVAFFATLAVALSAIYGAITRNAVIVRGARYGLYACAFLQLAMAGILWHGYFTHDFANKYIATYSDLEMPAIYLFTSFWGGEKGALLFWSTVLTIFSTIAIHQARERDVSYLGWSLGILCLAVFFYEVLMVFESNPFETFLTHHGPRDGDGLNPLLQNPTMAIHPPSLLTGYIAFTLPFAFGAASLITGRLDDQWAKDTRKWTIVSWLFLTIGLILGGAWAYQELGWGGFWMWDPVENAGLIPWFTATAFLHSIIIQERRGMLRRWNFSLVCLTFWLTIFGTFLTRSQLIVSIHAFADSKLSDYFLYYMAFLALVSFGLLAWRWKALRAEERIQSFLSREAMFVLNNVMLVMCAFIVLWGTLYSKISEAKGFQNLYNMVVGGLANFGVVMEELHQQQDLGEPWFNKVMVPAGVILLGLTAIGPLIAWRRTTLKSLRRTFVGPLVLSAVPMLVGTLLLIWYRASVYAELAGGGLMDGYNLWLVTVENTDTFAFFGIWFALFIFTGVGVEFWKGGRIRQRRHGGNVFTNMMQLSLKAKRRYGGYIVHIGVALAFLGFAGTAFKKEAPETPLHLGDSLMVGNYNLTFAHMDDTYQHGQGFVATRANVVVMRPEETVPEATVQSVVSLLNEREVGAFHVETRPHNPKVYIRFASRESRDRLREEYYLTQVMPKRFVQLPRRASDGARTLRFTFKDMKMIQVFPPIIHKHVDDVRRTLGSLDVGRAVLNSQPGQPVFTLTWDTPEAFARAQALVGKPTPELESVIMMRVNPSEDALELVTSDTGYMLSPEVRRYKKHASPTTEVAIWSRIHEDVYVAMRPDLSKSFVNLVAYVNPMINLLWLGAVVMGLGGVFLILPTDVFLRSRARATAVAAGALMLLVPPPARADAPSDAYTRQMLGAMRCACDEGGERRFYEDKTLSQCDCPLGTSMRTRVEEYMAGQSSADKASKRAQIDFFEALYEEDPSNQRYLIFPKSDFDYLMENTRCTCGCGKMALSQCPLDCPWNPVVQRFWQVVLALGMDRDAARDYYLGRANEVHRGEDDPLITKDSIILNQEKALSWGFPVAIGAGAVALILGILGMRMRVNARENARRAAAAPSTGPVSDADRELLADELDDIGV